MTKWTRSVSISESSTFSHPAKQDNDAGFSSASDLLIGPIGSHLLST